MRKVFAFIILATLALAIGCGGASQADNKGTISLGGNWTITANEAGSSPTVFTVNLVTSSCSVNTDIGTFTVTNGSGSLTCFIADNQTGQGSISTSGSYLYPPQGVLVGDATDPLATSGTATTPIALLFVEADSSGDYAVFNGNGSFSNSGTLSGTWTCNSGTPVCSGMSGTFTGTKQ
jgi:hypothetical protein